MPERESSPEQAARRPDEALALLHAELPQGITQCKVGLCRVAGLARRHPGCARGPAPGTQAGLHAGDHVHALGPGLRKARKLDGFKQLVREAGLVDYWKEYGWGDFCKPVGDDDFECH